MTPRETVILTRYIHALCPQQAMDDYTADAWHDVLATEPWLTLDQARSAVVQVKRRQPFVDVSEVIVEARRARRDELERENARTLLDPVAYRAHIEAQDSAFLRKLAARTGRQLAIGSTPPRARSESP